MEGETDIFSRHGRAMGDNGPRRSPRRSSGGVDPASNVAPSPIAQTPSKQVMLDGGEAKEKENVLGATPSSVRHQS